MGRCEVCASVTNRYEQLAGRCLFRCRAYVVRSPCGRRALGDFEVCANVTDRYEQLAGRCLFRGRACVVHALTLLAQGSW